MSVIKISQRELRNQSGDIMRRLERGEAFQITNRGALVGTLFPAQHSELESATVRVGTQVMSFPVGARRAEKSISVLDESRQESR